MAKCTFAQCASASGTEMSKYLIVIEKEGENWGDYAPDLPGLGVAASTREEVQQTARSAVANHVNLLRELGEPVPEPTAEVSYVAVA
jgi:predicted RNase H-like HicB family nuclease